MQDKDIVRGLQALDERLDYDWVAGDSLPTSHPIRQALMLAIRRLTPMAVTAAPADTVAVRIALAIGDLRTIAFSCNKSDGDATKDCRETIDSCGESVVAEAIVTAQIPRYTTPAIEGKVEVVG